MTATKWGAAALVLMLGACSLHEDNQQAAATDATTTDTATTGVAREEMASPTPAPAPVALPAPIQTQPGPKGSQVALNKVAVVGDILTVSMTYTGNDCCTYTKVDQVSVIDDATSQRLGVLKDNAGNYMAAPVGGDGKELRIDMSKPVVVWFKFPAPPPTTKTVSIAVPEVGPFDAVPIAR